MQHTICYSCRFSRCHSNAERRTHSRSTMKPHSKLGSVVISANGGRRWLMTGSICIQVDITMPSSSHLSATVENYRYIYPKLRFVYRDCRGRIVAARATETIILEPNAGTYSHLTSEITIGACSEPPIYGSVKEIQLSFRAVFVHARYELGKQQRDQRHPSTSCTASALYNSMSVLTMQLIGETSRPMSLKRLEVRRNGMPLEANRIRSKYPFGIGTIRRSYTSCLSNS